MNRGSLCPRSYDSCILVHLPTQSVSINVRENQRVNQMDNPETLETLDSQDTGKKQTKQAKHNTTQYNTTQHNTENVKDVKHGPRQK